MLPGPGHSCTLSTGRRGAAPRPQEAVPGPWADIAHQPQTLPTEPEPHSHPSLTGQLGSDISLVVGSLAATPLPALARGPETSTRSPFMHMQRGCPRRHTAHVGPVSGQSVPAEASWIWKPPPSQTQNGGSEMAWSLGGAGNLGAVLGKPRLGGTSQNPPQVPTRRLAWGGGDESEGLPLGTEDDRQQGPPCLLCV